MPTPNATPDRDCVKQATVSVAWFHCYLSYRFGVYPEHKDSEVSKELREAADEWDKYRNWTAKKGKPLLLDVTRGLHATFDDAVVDKLKQVLKIKYLMVDSIHFDIV